MLLDYLFLKRKKRTKKRGKKEVEETIPPVLELALLDGWSWVRQEVLITSVKYVNPPFCS